MFKKVFLAVFAVSIATLVIALMIWDAGETAQLDTGTQQVTRVDYIEDPSPSLIAFDPLGRTWAYVSSDVLNKNGALVVYQNGKKIGRYTAKDSPVLSWLPTLTSLIAFDNDGTVWVGTDPYDGAGLARFDGNSWITFSADSGLPSNRVTALAVDARGRAWIGMFEHGLAIYDKGDWQFFTAENSGLSVNTIEDIAFDDQGRAWITTDRGGVNIFDGADWKILTMENSGLARDFVDTILFDDQGRAWIDTSVDISVFDPVRNSWLHYPIGHDIGGSMFFDSTGRLWARRGMNIHVFDGQEWKYYFDPDFSVALILPDPQGNILMTNGYDEIRIVAAEDVHFNLQKDSEGQAKVFVESGGLLILTMILVLMWLAALFNSWWTIAMTIVLGLPVYLIWNASMGGSTPAEAAFFSGSYVWNPGVLLCFSILISGMLGNRVKRSGKKGAEWWGIVLGVVLGAVLDCGLIVLAFVFMAK